MIWVGMNTIRATVERISTLITTTHHASILFKLRHGDRRQHRRGVVLGGKMMNFMDRNGGVNNLWLNNFLVDNWLDSFMDMMMHMLALCHRTLALGEDGVAYDAFIFGLLGLGCQRLLGLIMVSMIEFAMLDCALLVRVLLGENLLLINGLYGAVVVILMYLPVDSDVDVLMLGRLDRLVLDGRVDMLMNSGIVVARLGHEVADSSLGLFHIGVM